MQKRKARASRLLHRPLLVAAALTYLLIPALLVLHVSVSHGSGSGHPLLKAAGFAAGYVAGEISDAGGDPEHSDRHDPASPNSSCDFCDHLSVLAAGGCVEAPAAVAVVEAPVEKCIPRTVVRVPGRVLVLARPRAPPAV